MAKEKTIWHCDECGHKQFKWTGSCSLCQKWNTFSEKIEIDTTVRFAVSTEKMEMPVSITEVKQNSVQRISSNMAEVDRVLGGGIVQGSLTLIGGDPGIGKSTLMLQLAQNLAAQELKVLYICGEESKEQTALRARRIRATHKNIFLLHETVFANIHHHIKQLGPDILIVDSIQIIYKADLNSTPGSVTQVRELSQEFMRIAKGLKIATFLIGHVTKSGEIAGPKVLEHIVDTVLDFEGDKQHGYRMLRAIKSRFGPTDDLAVFQMNEEGLKELLQPSEILLQERRSGISGSVIVPTLEGSRSLLIEVQALVSPSAYATSTRRSTGVEGGRLSLLLAVLEKRVGFQLHNADVFVSLAGGMKISEPALDLGIVLSVASSFANRAIDPGTVVMGEVGLAGEVRRVPRIENRLKEALQMGFSRALIPSKNLKEVPEPLKQQIKIIPIDLVEIAIHAMNLS